MNEKDFIMWLHGFFEISRSKTLDEKQVQIIKDHLQEFFIKKTPDRGEIFPQYPHYAPLPAYPMPTPYLDDFAITCTDDTASSRPNLGKTYC